MVKITTDSCRYNQIRKIYKAINAETCTVFVTESDEQDKSAYGQTYIILLFNTEKIGLINRMKCNLIAELWF